MECDVSDFSDSRKEFHVTVDDDLQELLKGFEPKNTAMSTKRALKNLQAWKDIRNLKLPCPREPTENYPPATIYQLLSALL